MHKFLFQLTVLIYFVSTAGFLVHVVTLRKDVERVATSVLTGGFVLHTVAVLWRWWAAGHPPFVNLHDALSSLAWAIVGVFLLFQMRYRIKSLGAFVTPVALCTIAASSLQPKEILPLPPVLKSAWLPFHAAICLLSYAVFVLAFCAAVMYLMQEREIKMKRLGGIFKRLPSLQSIDAMNKRCLTVGFTLLTIGIVTGSIWAEQAWGEYWSWDPKETWSLITWFLYAALLHQRITIGWRGRKVAIMTIVAFATLVFTFLGVSLILPGAHSYASWFK
ncbi:MAG TPA: c-type cytochrome biogenesis protein CcsB [Thermodesulfobacteriaceae bacterium]|nr:c-type cytochrome biogenesis protein CcsB [Thermodesulfobacteriaceae bacterium]